jgi:hypothetical protein
MLTSPASKRFKLTCDEPLSRFAVNFNSRRYIAGFSYWLMLHLWLVVSLSMPSNSVMQPTSG